MTRRARAGTGSVHPWTKKDPKTGAVVVAGWEAIADLGHDVNGKRLRRKFRGKDRAEVEQKLAEALEGKRKGVVATKRVTVQAWLEHWLRAAEAGGEVRPRTLDFYRWTLSQHVIPAIGRRTLEQLTPTDVDVMLAQLRKKGLSVRSVLHVRSVLRTALHQAMRDGLLMRNAAGLSKAPTPPHIEMKALDPQQAKAFIHALEGERLEALYLVAIGLGLRSGEVLGLTWDALDLEAGRLKVSQALQYQRGPSTGTPVMVPPKSQKSRRTLPLPAFVLDGLRRHRRSQAAEQLASPVWLDEGWGLCFTTPIGTPLNPRATLDDLKRILKAAGLPCIRFHDLRHSCASLLAASGVDYKVVSEILGHSTTRLTLDVYGHVFEAQHDAAASAMEALLGS